MPFYQSKGLIPSKRHTVFNSSMKDMLFVVLNVELTGKSLHYFLGSDMIL